MAKLSRKQRRSKNQESIEIKNQQNLRGGTRKIAEIGPISEGPELPSGCGKVADQDGAALLENRLRDWRPWLTRGLGALAPISSLAGIIGLYFVYGGLLATRQSNVDANRAWLYPENPAIDFVDIPGASGNSLKAISISGDTQNVGREPSTKTFFGSTNDIAAGIVPIEYDVNGQIVIPAPNKDACFRSSENLDYDSVIFPNQKLSYQRYFGIDGLSSAEIEAINSGEKLFFWADCVTYQTFGKGHRSRFCYYLVRSSFDQKMHTFRCPIGNDAD